ncbi:two-partner secretion domain-containing protein [Leptotrichia sp. oral taxon 847]|uniref:two-partner secretion domain-containing protein n=1 Tax=Leptotrichia sp. oral taxon 847 TaxID=1785996 RepID=UPI000B14D9FC|nr:filamentous hemagglutinin N-terminal domain-containing protein [Leptotrichia sp. oral taxon 847]
MKSKVLRKSIAFLLMLSMNMSSFAANLELDPNSRYNTKLDMSRNGTPIVNISTPNGRGISINEFLDYNVGHEGQVLNNADNIGRSHLAGIINANPNLAANQAANLIILQVNGSNRSDIEGYLEALSRQKVNVILSNENGIYLNGAGTINIRNFVPTTGRVKLQNGDFVGIDVEKGRVVIGSNGFDASTTDYVNVIAKALELQGSLVGNKVDVTLGENTVDKNGAVTSKHGINSVAIDASKLGSMYAGQISIISTDKGAGVNSRGIVYSRDKKLEITADGKINVAKIKGNGIEINGTEYDQAELASSDKGININAKNIKLNGETQAAGDINLNGNTQNNSKIYSEGNFNTGSLLNTGDINVAGNFKADDFKNVLAAVNTGGNLNVKNLENSGNIQVSKSTGIDGKLNNSGNLTSIDKITVKNDILNSGNISTNGDLSSKNAVSSGIIVANNFTTSNLQNDGKLFTNADLKTKYFKNTGEISAVGKISSDSMVSSGSIRTNEALDISGDLDNDGTLQSAKDITVSSNIKNSGKIYAGGNLSGKDAVSSGKIVSKNLRVNDLKNDGEIFTNEDLRAKNVTNTGKIASAGNISTNDLKTSGGIKSNKKVTVSGKLENDGDLEAVEDIKVSGNVRNTKEIATNGDFSGKNVVSKGKIISKNFESHDLENDGKILADGKVKARKVKNAGEISAAEDVSTDDLKTSGRISAKNLESEDLDNDGKISSNENVKARNIKNTGEIQAVGSISGNNLKTSGKVRANRKITVSGELENGGDLESGKSLTVSKNIKNTGKIAVNEDISGKDTQNSGTMYSKNLKTDNLKNDGKVEVGNDLKTADIENTKDITAVGKISGKNVNNSGKILTNGTLNIKNVKNIGKIAAGSDVTSQRLENSGVLATNGNITTSDSMINSGNIEGKNLDITGWEFTNSGKISADNIRARVNDTKNNGSISSANDIDLTTNTLTNTKEMLAVNDINSNNATVSNSGKMASNGKILLNNSSITNIGQILSGEISMQNAKKFDNTGTVKGNKTVLTTDQDLNLVGNLHGESLLEISGNNITNNGNTTGAGLIKISSNDFTNNKELASNAVIIDGRGNVVNNNMITGNDGKINGNSITNNDLIAFDNYLEMNAKSKVLNNKDKSIYGGNALIIKGSEILNDEGEILGGNMDLNASKITNNVGTVQSTGDIFVTSNDFQNIGRVSNLGSYEKYYETWDGIRLSESEVANEWVFSEPDFQHSSSHRSSVKRHQKNWLEEMIKKHTGNSKINSLMFSKYPDVARSKLYQRSKTTKTNTTEVPGNMLTGKIKSNADTEYGKIIASGNIIINSGNVKNRDSLISGGGLVDINATNFENSVTLGNAVQLKNGQEKLYLTYRHGSRKSSANGTYNRYLENGGIGYESGQPSIIEGAVVNVNAPNIIKNSIEAGNGKVLNNGGATGRALISSNSIGINKGTGSANGAVQVAGNALLSKVNSGFNGNLQVNGSSNNSFDRAIQISGNNSVIQNIKKTGTIDVNPLLSSAMFTMNMSPSSKYLLETRSKYISLGQYYGSDYFTSRVGYSEIWDRSKRLGDAFYENQLLTRALNEKLGTSFLNGKSNQELIQSMMDNAADEKARLGLVVGQALTQDQINALNEDIIWYVSKEVNGVSVLTPQIYLSSRTRESISDDTRNRIGGINGTYVKTKDFVNDGTKWGNGGVTYVEANTVRNETTTNLLSEISGDRTFISSVGNIENIGGKIKGNEVVGLISENGNVINNTTKKKVGFNNGEFDRSWHEEIGSIGQISSNGLTFIKGNSYESTGGILNTNHLELDVNKFNVSALSLSGEDKFGKGSNNYTKYGATEHLGGEVTANSTSGRIGNLNLAGSAFIGGDTQGLKIGKVNVESAVNSYDLESKQTSKNMVSKSSTYIKSHQEENVAGNLQLSGARIEGNLTGIGSNIDLGENTFVGGKLTTDSRELHNSFYEKNTSRGFSAGISHGTASLNYGKSSSTYDEKDTINAKSNLRIGDGSVLNNGAEITATNFEYGNIQINNGDVKYGARIDTRDVKTTSRSSNFGVSIGINSPIKDRIEQAAGAVKQARRGDTIGGLVAGVNSVTGTVNGMSQNISRLDGNRATMQDIQAGNFKVNNDFYVSGGINARFNTSRSSNNSHTESAVVTTMKPMNENSSITYNNVNNITYQGTQAQGGTFIYNNVKNIQKEAVELHNSYSSKNSGFGAGVSAGIGSNGQIKPSSIGGNVSANRSNLNTTETIYQNGNFQNVNEVHNNTGTMTLSGFNQEGGRVTGNIGKLVVESRQNTSTTTGSSSGIGIGISANGMPNSVNVNGSRTSGSRAFVDNQSSFIVGEGSNLHVGTVENTGAIIGKQSENGTTFKVDKYVGHDIQNYDTMTTTGISVGTSLGKSPRVTNIGFNQDDRDKQGITRNTVVGNVEIGEASGSPINRDVTKANEVTKDEHHSTNVNIESQTIEYATNPTKFKEDLEVAILEGKATGETVLKTIENLVNGGKEDIGDPERRSLNEIKEAVIRVKTAPEMNLIATGDLNSQEVLDTLKINGIEKFNPDDPDLPENVRARLDEVRKSGGEIEAFYDKTTNKIFINENVEDGETRALVAREWKISEDLKDGKGKANDEGQLKATVAGELAYDDMMKRAGEGKTRSINTDDLNVGVMDENSEITADFNNKHVDKFFGRVGSILNKVRKGDIKGAYKEAKQTKQDVTRVLNNDIKTVLKGGPAAKKTIKESANATVYAIKKVAPKSTKKSPPKRKKRPVHKTKKEQEKEFIEHMNSIARGYYENEPKYSKSADKVGTLTFIVANQNIKIGDGSSKVSDEVFAKAASSTIGQVVATGNFKMVPTKDKEYENNNKGVQKQVKAAKVEAQRKTRNSKDKDYYVRVDGKNKTVTVEESKRPKGYGSYLYKSLVLDPIESFHNFHEAEKSAFHGNIGGAFKNTLKGIGNLTSPLTLGVGSWAGDNYARFKPEEVQYGTREEVLKRKQTENLLVSTPIDMTIGFATSKIPVKKITSSKIKNPVTRTTTTESRATRKGATVLEEGHYYKLQQQKNIESTGLPNYSIKPLTDIKDPALNVDKIRNYLQENSGDYIKGKYDVKGISVATAKVTTKDGKVENILSVSGKAWNGNAPKEVTINNVKYKVIIKDSESVKTYTGISRNGNKVRNLNHAEKKLASYIQDNYSGKEVKVDIGVQNTSIKNSGMCPNCNSSMFDFAKDNPDMRITIYEGTTGINP